jgi:FixJ family two-component response regulator
VSARPPRVLIADGATASRTLEPALRRAGWNVVTVTSSLEVLRAVRDHDISVVLIDPALPGAGVSGVDVVRTLKSAPRFRELPVFFLLRAGQAVPAGVLADGAFELDQVRRETLLKTLRGSLPTEDAPDGALDGLASEVARAADAAMARVSSDEVRAVVERIVREMAREIVPEVAERLIGEEIRRLRREYGFPEPPR